MGANTGSDKLFNKVVCLSVCSFFDSDFHNITSCALSDFNISNLSEATLYREDGDGRRLSTEAERETNPWNLENLWHGIALGVVLAFLCLLTTVGNSLVLHAVRTEKSLQTVSNLFIVSLAVADVVVGIIVMPTSAFYIFTERWMLGVAVCQIWIGVDYTASTASILNLFILSLDRYWSVRQPLKYLHKRTKRRALSMIAFVWAVSSLWIIPISSWHHFAHGGIRTVPSDKCDTEYARNSYFKIITAFFNFYLPLTVMYILYLRIFIAIRKRSEFELGQRNPGGTVLSYKSHIPNSNSIDESECSGSLSCSVEQKLGGTEKHLKNASKSCIPSSIRNLRVLTVRRHKRPCIFKDSNFRLYKVEYVYDENVVDPQTEKIERYYYEDHYPVSYLSRPTWLAEREKFPVTNKQQRLQRSPHRLANKIPLKLHSTSLTKSASKGNDWYLNDQDRIHYIDTPGNSCIEGVKKNARRKQNKCNTLVPNRHNNKRAKERDHEEASFSPSVDNEQSRVSSSISSPAEAFENECRDRSRSCSFNQDAKDIIEIGFAIGDRRLEGSKHILRHPNLDNIKTQKVIKDLVYPSTMANSEISSNANVNKSLCKNVDDSDGIIVLQEEDNRNFITLKNSCKERLGTVRQSSSLNKEIKAAKQLGVIMGAFTLCFLPYFILFLVVAFCDNCIKPGHLTAATWIGYLNSTLNPFLYPLCNANFRTKFRSMLTSSGQRRSPLRAIQMDYLERNTHLQARYD